MGMGDKKPPFIPSYEPILCDVSGHLFKPCSIRQCPEPHVIKRYGTGGVANVSVWVCRKCPYHQNQKLFGGVSCRYGLDNSIPPGT